MSAGKRGCHSPQNVAKYEVWGRKKRVEKSQRLAFGTGTPGGGGGGGHKYAGKTVREILKDKF